MRSAGLASSARSCWRVTQASHRPPSRTQFLTRRSVSHDNGPPRSIAKLLQWKPQVACGDVVVNGFIRSVRSMKAWTFVVLGDGSSLAPLQAVVPTNQAEGYGPKLKSPTRLSLSQLPLSLLTQSLCSLAIGAAIRLKGSWVPSPGAGQSHELHVDKAEVLGPSDPQVSLEMVTISIGDIHQTGLVRAVTDSSLYTRHFRFRKNIKRQSTYEPCHIFGREPLSIQPSFGFGPKQSPP